MFKNRKECKETANVDLRFKTLRKSLADILRETSKSINGVLFFFCHTRI
jgi:hypothetical protein